MKGRLWKHIRIERSDLPVYKFVTIRDTVVEQKTIDLGPRTVPASVNREHLKALQEMNIDGVAQLESVLYNEMEQMREGEAIQALTGLAVDEVGPPKRGWSWLNRLLGYRPKHSLKNISETMNGISKAWVRIEREFKLSPSFMLVSPMTAGKLSEMPDFRLLVKPHYGGQIGVSEAVGQLSGLEVLLSPRMPDHLIVVGAGNAEQLIGGLVGAETEPEVSTTQLDEINQSVMLTQRRQFAFVGLGHRGYIKVPVTHDKDTLLDYIKLKIKGLWKQG
jgi:hypothetical protein